MDSEKLAVLRLATAYDSLSGSLAYKDLIAWLEDSVESLEMQAAQVPPEQREHFHDYFTLWQQRKKVVNGIKIHVSEYLQAKKDLEEELQNERPSEPHDFNSGSTSLPGY